MRRNAIIATLLFAGTVFATAGLARADLATTNDITIVGSGDGSQTIVFSSPYLTSCDDLVLVSRGTTTLATVSTLTVTRAPATTVTTGSIACSVICLSLDCIYKTVWAFVAYAAALAGKVISCVWYYDPYNDPPSSLVACL